jgi:hypothetical protein
MKKKVRNIQKNSKLDKIRNLYCKKKMMPLAIAFEVKTSPQNVYRYIKNFKLKREK